MGKSKSKSKGMSKGQGQGQLTGLDTLHVITKEDKTRQKAKTTRDKTKQNKTRQ